MPANIVGFTVSAVLPGRLGELAKPLHLARKEGLRRGFAIGTVVVERVFDALTNCFLLGLFLLARPLSPPPGRSARRPGESLVSWMKAGVALAAVLLALTLLVYFFRERALRVAVVPPQATPGQGRGGRPAGLPRLHRGAAALPDPDPARPLLRPVARRLAGHHPVLLGLLPGLPGPRALRPRHGPTSS
ncbi:MAG: flippase-like domain-containing protein [Candidatus Moduliflexus flocculans]|nr:flippase-like domain-containing protein [Candidatus Moduliflexus flocculans]